MLHLLRDYVPVHGPLRLRAPLCKSLGDDIFEFRKEPKGKRLRVAWFYDSGRVVVCAVAFTKAEKLPAEEKARAIRMRARYFRDQRNGTNQIDEI
jgi:hypothetical protein